jgi:hypothetical protein
MPDYPAPRQTRWIQCPYCHHTVSFPFSGGPHQTSCRVCGKPVSFEIVHDGKKWRTKVLNRPSKR